MDGSHRFKLSRKLKWVIPTLVSDNLEFNQLPVYLRDPVNYVESSHYYHA